MLTYGFQDAPLKYYPLFLVNIGTAASFLKVSQIFFGKKKFTYVRNAQAQYTSLFILATGILLIGIAPDFVFAGLLGVETFGVNPASLSSLGTYFLTLGFGFALYWLLVKRDYAFFRRVRNFELSFQNANLLFIVYIAALGMVFLLI